MAQLEDALGRAGQHEQRVPRIYNLITDPKKEYNMAAEATWVLPVMFEEIVAFQATLAHELPIRLGAPDLYEPPR